MSTDTGKRAYIAISEILDQLRHEDPVTRFNEATDAVKAITDAMGLAAMHRRAAVRQLRDSGWTIASIANEFGVTPARIGQIEAGETRRYKKKEKQSSETLHDPRFGIDARKDV